MKIFNVLLTTLLIFGLSSPSFAEQRRAEIKNLTVGGAYVNGWVLTKGNGTDGLSQTKVITTDSIYQSGNYGYNTLATMINATGDVSVSYQVSYDNINWFVPNTTLNNLTGVPMGNIQSIATIDTGIISNTWVIGQWALAPYVRYIYTNLNAGPSIITADALWQDAS